MPGKILIIDDDDLVCISLKRLLVKLDFDAEFCMKAEEAFQVIEKYPQKKESESRSAVNGLYSGGRG